MSDEEIKKAIKKWDLEDDYKNQNICLLIPFTDTKANTNIMWYRYEDIKTIVTKEMMESISYKVTKM